MNKRTFLMIFLFALCFYNTSRADEIIYNGATYDLYDYPLKFIPEFKYWNPKPIFGEEADKKIYNAFDTAPYSCTWIVLDNYIYLQSINGKNTVADLQTIFPEKYDNGLVLADWIDTTLYAPYGKMLYSWGPIVSESIFEHELAFKVSKGKILSVKKCDNSKTRALKDDKLLQKLIQKNINWENLPESDTINRRVYIQVISTDSLGQIDSVKVSRGVNDIYDREAVRIVKAIPEWPVYYKHGKVFTLYVYPIAFNRSDNNRNYFDSIPKAP